MWGTHTSSLVMFAGHRSLLGEPVEDADIVRSGRDVRASAPSRKREREIESVDDGAHALLSLDVSLSACPSVVS
jgi:hypothetical protein